MKKRRFFILLAALVMALVFAATGAAETGAAEANPAETETGAAALSPAETETDAAGMDPVGTAGAEPEQGADGLNADAAARGVRFDEAAAPYEGTWVTFDDGFRLYLPGEWFSYDVTEEQAEAGLFFRAGNDGSDAVVGDAPMGMAVSYMEADGLETPDDLLRDFERVGFANLEERDVNGIPAVYFEKAGEDYRGVSFYHALYPGYVMTVYVTPMGEAGDAVRCVGDAMLDSLSPYAPEAQE